MKITVPTICDIEIEVEEFRKECRKKFLPPEPPKYKLGDLITVKRELLQKKFPGLIVGISPRISGWHYDIITPRYDSVLESNSFPEVSIELYEEHK